MLNRMQALFDAQGGTQGTECFLANISYSSRQKLIFSPAVAKFIGKIQNDFSHLTPKKTVKFKKYTR